MFRSIVGYFVPSQATSTESTAATCFLTEKEAKIQLAYRAGIFSPFQNSLQGNYCSWNQKPFWRLLEKLDKGVSIQDSPQELEILYLFALLQEPLSSGMAKQAALAQYLSSLTEERKKSFLYSLSSDLPPCIAVAVLQYASLDVCQETCKQSLKHRSVRICEQGPCNWCKEVFTNASLYQDTALFFDQLFSCYPEEDQKQLTYYLFLHSDPKEQQMFLSVLSPSLRATVERWTQEVKEHLRTSLDSPILEGKIKIPFRGNQREYFTHLFCQTALDNPASFRIVAEWNESDWKLFKAHVKEPHAISLALKWMHQMAQFLSVINPRDQQVTQAA